MGKSLPVYERLHQVVTERLCRKVGWDVGTGDVGTLERGDLGTLRHGDSGMRGRGDLWSRGPGDIFSKYKISEMGEHPQES